MLLEIAAEKARKRDEARWGPLFKMFEQQLNLTVQLGKLIANRPTL